MQFVPVPGADVLMRIHEARRQDYAADSKGVDGGWMNAKSDGVPAGHEDSHPVTEVSWHDAARFCEWLSKKEGRRYRLPTDQEWSFAVGIGNDEVRTSETKPKQLDQGLPNIFPWGGSYPPREKDWPGNFRDLSFHESFPQETLFIDGYRDGFPTTAPVMSFKPNDLGIHDMGGNAAEWCQDWYDGDERERVLRGPG